MGDHETPVLNDGRRLLGACKECGSRDDLSVEVDPVDNTLYIACRACECDVAVAEVVAARMELGTVVTDLDQLDPQLRGAVEVTGSR